MGENEASNLKIRVEKLTKEVEEGDESSRYSRWPRILFHVLYIILMHVVNIKKSVDRNQPAS